MGKKEKIEYGLLIFIGILVIAILILKNFDIRFLRGFYSVLDRVSNIIILLVTSLIVIVCCILFYGWVQINKKKNSN